MPLRTLYSGELFLCWKELATLPILPGDSRTICIFSKVYKTLGLFCKLKVISRGFRKGQISDFERSCRTREGCCITVKRRKKLFYKKCSSDN